MIHILTGDITTINTDIIVNSAHPKLLGGGGVDGAIHKRAGVDLKKECQEIVSTYKNHMLPVGEAVITQAYGLNSKYIIHTVGPKYRSDSDPSLHLKLCYKNSLLLADQYKCKSIAFPAISTGVYAYPFDEASKIAYNTVIEVLKECKTLTDVVFVFYTDEDTKLFKKHNLI